MQAEPTGSVGSVSGFNQNPAASIERNIDALCFRHGGSVASSMTAANASRTRC